MEISTFIWIGVAVIGFFILRWLWKNVRRGITLVLVVVAALSAFRVLVPNGWHNLSQYVQTSVANILRR